MLVIFRNIIHILCRDIWVKYLAFFRDVSGVYFTEVSIDSRGDSLSGGGGGRITI